MPKKIEGIGVSTHAMAKFNDRFSNLGGELREQLLHGIEIHPTKKHQLRKLLNHGVEDTQYYRLPCRGIAVVRDAVVVTVLPIDAYGFRNDAGIPQSERGVVYGKGYKRRES